MFKTRAGRILLREGYRKTSRRRGKTPKISRRKNERRRRIRTKRKRM
jgi:hypothetical protein